MSNDLEFVHGISPTWASGSEEPGKPGYWGARLLQMLWAIPARTITICLNQALVASWFQRGGRQPVDALPLLGAERNMPRYPVESHQQYRDRLWGAWDAWEFAGNASAVVSQFEAAGFVGVEIKEPFRTHSVTGNTHGEWLREPTGYWSHFWLFFPAGSHNFGPPLIVGAPGLIVGGGWTVGTNASAADVQLVRGIANKWRPAHVIVREFLFEISGWTVGTGHFVDEDGLTVGGDGVSIQGI